MRLFCIVLFVVCCGQSLAAEGAFESNEHPEGRTCSTASGPGVCRRLGQCDPPASAQVDLFVCGLSGAERLICCPTTTASTPPPAQSLWEIVRTEEAPPSLPQNAVTNVTVPFPDTQPEASNSIQQQEAENLCNSPSGLGVCKPIQQCEPYLDKTLKYADLMRCSFVGFDEIVCCPTTSQTQGTSTPSTGTGAASGRTKMRPSVLACQRHHETARTTFHISGGKEASLGEFPYVGAVLYSSQQSGRRYEVGCGATLISERFALTAAHCVVIDPKVLLDPPELVRFGSVEWNPTENATYRFDARIKNITAHELYRPSSYYHDVAVIEFTEPVPMSILVAPICLHTSPDDIDASVRLQIVGWGISSMFSHAKAEVLQKTDVSTVSLLECNSTHIDYGISARYSRGLIEGQYCAHDPGFEKDSCSGDSGGPLIVALDDWDELVGVVSFGKGCGSIVPSIYTRIAYYLEWIENIVWPSTETV